MRFLQNYLSNKKLSEGSHCDGYVDVASATAAGGESCKAGLFLAKNPINQVGLNISAKLDLLIAYLFRAK